MHHGVKGMRWGIRKQKESSSRQTSNLERRAKIKKAVKIGAIIAGTVLVSYGVYKLVQVNALPKPFTPQQLHAMGVATVEPKRIKIPKKTLSTPVRNITKGPRISGHSERLTRYGAARASAIRNKGLMYNSSGKPTPRFEEYYDRYMNSSEEMARLVTANGGKVPRIRPSTPIRRLRHS